MVVSILIGGSYNQTCDSTKGDYVTVKWIKSLGHVSVLGEYSGPVDEKTRRWADSDSLVGIVVTGGATDLTISGHRAVLSEIDMTGNKLVMASELPDASDFATIHQYSQHNKIMNSTIVLDPSEGGHIWRARTALFDTLDRCHITITANENSDDGSQLSIWYNVQHVLVRDCLIELTNNGVGTGDPKFGMMFRDSTRLGLFERDTILVHDGSFGRCEIALSAAGNARNEGSSGLNRYESCIFKNDDEEEDGNSYHTAVLWQDGYLNDTVQFCSFITGRSYNAVQIIGTVSANSIFRHNTLFTAGKQPLNADVSGTSGSRFVSNLLYSKTAPNNSSSANAVAFLRSSTFAVSDTNLYYSSAGSLSDSAYAIYNGSSHVGPSAFANRSLWLNPTLLSNSYSASDWTQPDIRLANGSGGVGTIWPDGYVGALSPPSAVTNLFAGTGCRQLFLSWTAPGKHANVGTATAYDLRKSSAAITEANFYDAAVLSTSAPQSAGTTENYMITAGDCETHYFAVRASDENGNWSHISNVVTGETECPPPSCSPLRQTLDRDAMPIGLAIVRVEPVPVVKRMMVRLAIPASLQGAAVNLSLFDLAGRRIATLVQGAAIAGYHDVVLERDWSGTGGGSGVMFLRLRVGNQERSRSIVVLR